jgi:hypothetical protein
MTHCHISSTCCVLRSRDVGLPLPKCLRVARSRQVGVLFLVACVVRSLSPASEVNITERSSAYTS